MADTTIKLSEDVRDRLGVLAAEWGTSARGAAERLVRGTPTAEERRLATDRGMAYVRTHLAPDMSEQDVARADALRRKARRGELGHVV